MNKRTIVNIHDAKTNLSKLVEQIETGSRSEVVIARAGKPVARLVPIVRAAIRLGVADGTFSIPSDIDTLNPLIEEMFAPTPRNRRGAKPGTRRRS
ncbi:MAG TPA: type II toxin-antitoxin system prevent-host-death family antitoxin [Dongiaceae bacterium]|jgi:prevent-host-death family protein|nr:type II toxin-antitoxin system prevent-host-death family antitoxin [Dongiaceae bacterium]